MTAETNTDSGLFQFAEEASNAPVQPVGGHGTWRILVIDDDDDMHQATGFALDGVQIFGRSLVLLHAYTAAQARQLLQTERDIAVVLLDVVMETPDAGLQLVEHIREVAGLHETRIVLRTGQPGYAPEQETLLKFDINDYRTKSELTHHKLLNTITTTLRAYKQLCQVESSRKGLEQIVEASATLLNVDGIHRFAAGVITQIAGILDTPPEGLVCALQGDAPGAYTVLAAAGSLCGCVDQPIAALHDFRVTDLLRQSLAEGQSLFLPQEAVLYLGERNGQHLAVYVQSERTIDPVNVQLLKVFSVNLNAYLRNILLLRRLHLDAYEDPMLKLPNRARFIDLLSERSAAGTQDVVLVVVDIDDFASVNDLMGHDYGDALLRAVVLRLQQRLGPEVVLARVSGNAFGLLGPSALLDPDGVLQLFQEPLGVLGQPHRVTATLGLCDLDDPAEEGVNWLKNVNIALKQAKRNHRGQHVRFSRDMALHSRNRAQLLSRLHSAFDQDRLFLAFQPQLDLHTGALVGLEALIRWRGDDGRAVPPDVFIPVAEQSGLIIGLGDWVLRTACVTMRQLLDQGIAPHRMAVNVSVVQFQSPGFTERVAQALEMAGIESRHLELEVTESVSLIGHGVIETMLHGLRQLGVSVAIDDFGTGYSSLSYLERLPLDRIKIDKAFVQKMEPSGGPRIAELIAQLGHKLKLRVLAEGIEDAGAWRLLQAMGVHEGQGFYIARPLELPPLLGWLRQHRDGALDHLNV